MADYQTTAGEVIEVPKVVLEYPLPAAMQTHEMAAVGDDLLLVSQQTNSSLVKVALHPTTGQPLAAAKFTVKSACDGLHGLYASREYPGQVWATLQFESALILLDPGKSLHDPPTEQQRIQLPECVFGPHRVLENGDDLWTSCKDSGHVVRVNHRQPSDMSIYPCSPRPIFMAIHPTSGDVYATLDLSSKIFRLVKNSNSTNTSEIDIPEAKGSTPVGMVEGKDGNVWFVLLGGSSGGTGTFGRISSEGHITWFRLTTPAGAQAGLIHLAFDSQYEPVFDSHYKMGGGLRLWLLGSTMGSQSCFNAIFTVYLYGDPPRIEHQDTITLPTPYCMTHRILPHRTGLFVTELAVSILAHVRGAATTLKNQDGTSAAWNGVLSETSDAYSLWGLGICSDRFKYASNVYPFMQYPSNYLEEHATISDAPLTQSTSQEGHKRQRSDAPLTQSTSQEGHKRQRSSTSPTT